MNNSQIFINGAACTGGFVFHNNFLYILNDYGTGNGQIKQYTATGTLVNSNWTLLNYGSKGVDHVSVYNSYMYICSAKGGDRLIVKIKINSDGSSSTTDYNLTWYDTTIHGNVHGVPESTYITGTTMYICTSSKILKVNMLTSDTTLDFTVYYNSPAKFCISHKTYMYVSITDNNILQLNLSTGVLISGTWFTSPSTISSPRGMVIFDDFMYVTYNARPTLYPSSPSGYISRINMRNNSITEYWAIMQTIDSVACSTLYIYDGYIYSATKATGHVYRSALPLPLSNICFVEGTLVMSDQGIIPIETVTKDNTIFSKKVKMLTITRSFHEYLITFEKDEIAPNVPNQKITMSKNHKVLYNGLLMDAENVGGTKVQYNGQLLYNILLEDHGIVLANNLICETLDPTNVIAKLYTSDYSDTMKDEIIQRLNDTIHDMPNYKKLAIKLLA
jgi:hypothetical protein